MAPGRLQRLDHTEPAVTPKLIEGVRNLSLPLRGPIDLEPLLEHIGRAKYVLLGEASHGTHEYYAWRAEISQRLIERHGFNFIAVEGDWPDCDRINRFVKGQPDSGENARQVLHHFERWPTWMWANEDVEHFVKWLRSHNDRLPVEKRIGFHGLDVYSLWESLYLVLGYLAKHLPQGLPEARRAFQCFEPYGEDVQEYARATRWVDASCEDEVVALLADLRRLAEIPPHDGPEAHFNAEQNALVVKNAERYYRTMVRGGPESWNIRDRHMTETLERLMRHHGPSAKGIVWEHNTHVGDARHTDMADDGMVNVGQLVRERHSAEGVAIVGFGSFRGSVIAGVEWEAPMQRMTLPPARTGSWEEVMHSVGAEDRLLLLDGAARANEAMLEPRGHRAVGVVYRSAYERFGNYVPTILPLRYDAFLYFDESQALRPLKQVKPRAEGEVPETYPSGV
jgi:erythromycin esterase-like protein